ncbi:Malate dehydrogenase 1 mitochondrial [Bienertia sinuspersici]
MRTEFLRSVQSAVRRSNYASSTRNFSSSASNPERKVTVLGAAGGIGQPLSMLMKLNPLVSTLSLTILLVPLVLLLIVAISILELRIVANCSHINTRDKVSGYMEDKDLAKALEGSDVVIIPAGVPRKPGMTRDDLFNINAGIVKNLCQHVAKHCPNEAGTYDPKRLFGVTTLDVVRAKTFYATKTGLSVEEVNVPVVGGHAGITILPLFSQAFPQANLGEDDIVALTKRTQDGGTEVVEAKAGKGSATLSMAYAGAIFADACLKGLNGVPDVVECSFVESNVTELPFFASKVRLGVNGVEEIHGLGSMSDYEKEGLAKLIPELKSSIQKGIDFAHKN